jgi:hypothetical protein
MRRFSCRLRVVDRHRNAEQDGDQRIAPRGLDSPRGRRERLPSHHASNGQRRHLVRPVRPPLAIAKPGATRQRAGTSRRAPYGGHARFQRNDLQFIVMPTTACESRMRKHVKSISEQSKHWHCDRLILNSASPIITYSLVSAVSDSRQYRYSTGFSLEAGSPSRFRADRSGRCAERLITPYRRYAFRT